MSWKVITLGGVKFAILRGRQLARETLLLYSGPHLNSAERAFAPRSVPLRRRAMAAPPDTPPSRPGEDESTLYDLLVRAAGHHQAGRMEQADALYRAVLRVHPENPDANHNLGVLAMQRGLGVAVALPHFRTAWESDPAHSQHTLSYLRALVLAGDIDAARRVREDGIRRGLPLPALEAFAPGAPPAGRPAPGSPSAAEGPAWKARGLAALQAGRRHEAIESLREAVVRLPGDADARVILGNLLLETGLAGEAEEHLRHAAARAPQAPAAYLGLGRALLALNRFEEAEVAFRRAGELQPASSPALCGLARVLAIKGRRVEAEELYAEALAHDPRDVEAYAGLGAILLEAARTAEAEALCRRVLAGDPGRIDVQYDLATLLMGQGRLEEADACYRAVLARRPDHLESRSCTLFIAHYRATQPPEALIEQAKAYGRLATARAGRPYAEWTCDPRPSRLRVGLVSGDLRNHPVGFFVEAVVGLAANDRIEWVAYPTFQETDDLTGRLRAHIGTWRSLVGLSDAEAARRIHDDGIHVLIDLSGHTVHNRLPVFAWRPAPVQVTWMGYFATTGLAEMDYILADRVGLPPELHAHFTERVKYLPDTRLCFTPPRGAPLPRPLPALANGFVTFGCFQAQPKITGDVLQAWSRILARCPGSRLRIQNEFLSGASGRETVTRMLAGAGIDTARTDLHGFAPRQRYLEDCGAVDFLLDTFPYPGGTTTCEALWMGVPTLSLAGRSMIARQGASLLAAAGMEDWVVSSPDEYVERAVAKTRELPALAALRQGLRDQVARSPLFDASRFARDLEQALWELWREPRDRR